ncbi:hypothetical protein COU96_00085, partial [Candidatus Shapirobacteria bacterium CG10_big_fil_rev_8_21_14_0_10_38_14]
MPTAHSKPAFPILFLTIFIYYIDLASMKINKLPITINKKRKDLTLDYIRNHYDPRAKSIQIMPKIIIIHWAGGRSKNIKTLFEIINPVKISANRSIAKNNPLNISAHFGIGRQGDIHQFMPETMMARHAAGLNNSSIGIENIGNDDRPLT